jgi:hypothetical protein
LKKYPLNRFKKGYNANSICQFYITLLRSTGLLLYEIQKPFRYEKKYTLSQVIIAFINSAWIGDSECPIQ